MSSRRALYMDDHFQIYPEKVSFCWLVNKEAGPPIYWLRHISKSWSRCGGLASKIGQVIGHPPRNVCWLYPVRSSPCVQSNRVAKAFMKMKKGLCFQLHSMILQSVTTMAKNHRSSAPQRMLVTRWHILFIHCTLIVRSRTTRSSKLRVSSSLRYPYLILTPLLSSYQTQRPPLNA